jgi:oxygen-dependent protoporphyrinogen oxidase
MSSATFVFIETLPYLLTIFSFSIPQYVVGHYNRVKEIRRYIDDNRLGLDLTGASLDGVSVNDCVHNAFKVVEQLATKFSV